MFIPESTRTGSLDLGLKVGVGEGGSSLKEGMGRKRNRKKLCTLHMKMHKEA